MYDNKVYYVSQVEAQKKLTELKKRDEIFTVVIDGTKIKNWDDYIKAVTEAFHFPTFEKRNYDGYLYYFTDLMWIDKDAFALFILDYDEFMNQNINEKKMGYEKILRSYSLLVGRGCRSSLYGRRI